MTDRTQPDSGRIITSGDILLHDAKTALMYEELRAAIDDGREGMTHADALAEIAAMLAENIELRAKHASIRAGGVQPLRKCLHQIEEPLEKVLASREAEIALLKKALMEAEAAPQQEVQEPFAWESTTPGYIKYITQARYEKFSPKVQRWYKPYKCSSCAAPQPAPAPLSDDVVKDAARYRWLRDVPMAEWPDELATAFQLQQNAIWDAAIDAARKQGANHDNT